MSADRYRELTKKWIGPAPDGTGVMNASDAGMEMITEDCVWQMPPSNPMGKVEGRDAIGRIQARAKQVYQWDTIRIEPLQIIADEGGAVALYRFSCRQVMDDEPYSCLYAHFLRFRGDEICEIVDLFDSLAWYRQSGHKLERKS